ncbi:DUF2953 domain-containing protein [Fredinandcohnia quinoae]|uniref:DUF2953 domain-containing protein n=1 Tax=Fredinandcohnia quinoae TaxID=2918902 RepID=A0AAW5EC14_9BACI|nr:DUF2953 domain-containing protein [Fredinandcohnia sp. SECRCQ15]MCH1627591.1 DUF2953 domain-containing protein [Fredinandcohnia sp. SECRCQ15]
MKWFLLILLIIILLLLVITFTKLKVFLHFKHFQDDDYIKIKFSAWFGLLKYTIHIPMVRVDDDSPSIIFKQQSTKSGEKKKKITWEKIKNSLYDTKKILEHVVKLHHILKGFLKNVTISKFEWHSVLGLGDAAHTGVLVGLGWSLKGTLFSMVSHYMNVQAHPDYSVTPSFQKAISQTELTCMIHFRIGHAMLAGIRLFRSWKGGIPKFKSPSLTKLSDNNTKKSV